MVQLSPAPSQAAFPHCKGPMADTVRTFDWAASPLGPISAWPNSLTAAVEIVLESPSARLLVWGPTFTTVYNDAYVPVLGAHAIDGTGLSYPNFRPDIWPNIENEMCAAMAGCGQIVTQLRTVERGNSTEEAAFFRLSFTPIRDEAGIVRGVMQDLVETTSYINIEHELNSENKRFRALFNQAPIFLLLASAPDFEVQYANTAYSELVGGRDLIGKTIAQAVPEAVAQGFVQFMTSVCETGQAITFKDKAFDLSDAMDEPKRVYLDFIYQPIVDPEGKVAGILCVGSDTTVAHLATEQAEQLRDVVNHNSRLSAMSIMAETLAHELSQPLTAAGNYLAGAESLVRCLDSGELTHQILEAIELAEQQIHRAGEVIRSARKMVEGEREVRKIISLSMLIARAMTLSDAANLCPGVKIETRLDLDATMVCVDPVQAEQVLLNLIRNACEAMHDKQSRELSISSRRLDADYAEILIRDTGQGLPDNDVTGLFDAFKKSTTGGLGIGLSLSRTIVEAQGGKIWAKNNPDGGATFGFTLPIGKGLAAAA